ncbi:MAG: protease complex subunit PrcB family protein [Lachnospiraceae bacterium]|nr:protease complex subunit PrcB family protein [Lachnospiraceae bacterium]
MTDQAKQKIGRILLVLGMLCLTAGCGAKADKTAKLRDMEFSVLAEEEVPEELRSIIEEKKTESFKLTFCDGGDLYICTGYGKQPSGGYSISVTELYETENAVYVHTNLLGPSPGEVKKESASYPYIVIKTEKLDKTVVFE